MAAKSLAGQTALITGAGRGIGRAVALAYAKEGADLILCSRTQGELDEVAQECGQAGARVLALACDVGSSSAVRDLVAQGLKRFGRIDILVNNAGILGPSGPLADVREQDWEETLRVNLTGPFLVTREVLKAAMLVRRSGCVINVSSGRGRAARSGWGPYTASKFGLEGMSQVFAEECRESGIRVYTINPRATGTAMRAAAFPQEDPATLKTPAAVAQAFVDLARSTGRMLS